MITNGGRRRRLKMFVGMSEDDHQKNVVTWATTHSGNFPELSRLFHIPNGGKRTRAEAGIFKAMGVRPGAPDLCLPVARQGFHALYIEMKPETGKATETQKEWGEFLASENNKWVVCRGWIEAVRVIADYLGMPHYTVP